MRTKYFRRRENPRLRYTLNEHITYPTLRVIDEEGKQRGILSRQDAIVVARDEEKDLVLITNHVSPPVVKLINFNKFLYQENKRLKEAKKGNKKSMIKDVKLSLFIAKGDFDRLVAKAQEFLQEGHQVRIGLLLRGREMGKKPMAFDLMKSFIQVVGEVSVHHEPKMQGRVLIAVIGRKK
ncbi:MAG TPA: translation initiation factor IF-3 [Patescibacteria group bacterium]|nr:translation initiation factor IF-3 [Patescibacteria group bacterium]